MHTGQGETGIFIRGRDRSGRTKNEKHVRIFVKYSYEAGTHGHIHTRQGRTGSLWTPSCNISVKEVTQNYPCLV